MDRRSFILGAGMVAGSSRFCWAQARPKMAKLGVLMDLPATDPAGIMRVSALMEGLTVLGWKIGSNLDLHIRWGTDDPAQRRRDAQALVQAGVDVVVASATPPTREVQQLTKTIPIVFTTVIDPVGAGFVESLAHPGGNLTGFTNLEASISGKWVQILLEIEPRLEEIVIVMEPQLRASRLQAEAIEDAARAAHRQVRAVDLLDDDAIHVAFQKAHDRRSGAVLTSSPWATARRRTVIGAAEQYKVATIYPGRHHIVDGGLASYGPDLVAPFRQAAGYVDRILRGETPANLPVQLPTRLETVLNMQAARGIGINFPAALLARADEVID